MKAKGIFNECTLTASKPIFSGTTTNGVSIYADERDVEKGFQLFRDYKLKIFNDGFEVPYRGFCRRSKIIRIPIFDFFGIPDWMRFENLKFLLNNSEDKVVEAVANLEKIDPDRVISTESYQVPTLQI